MQPEGRRESISDCVGTTVAQPLPRSHVRPLGARDQRDGERIQAYFNVPRDKFEDDSYANGDTSELAARGLYGDYALFFPAGILSVAQTDAQGQVNGQSDGLDLGQVDDILLRIDYVSVAR